MCTNTSVNNVTIVEPLDVAFVDLTPDDVLEELHKKETVGNKILYIADTANHCIRSVDLGECIQL